MKSELKPTHPAFKAQPTEAAAGTSTMPAVRVCLTCSTAPAVLAHLAVKPFPAATSAAALSTTADKGVHHG